MKIEQIDHRSRCFPVDIASQYNNVYELILKDKRVITELDGARDVEVVRSQNKKETVKHAGKTPPRYLWKYGKKGMVRVVM